MTKEALEQKLFEKNPIYSKNQAIAEAERCLFCFDPPCVKACPTSIDIPTFIKKIAVGDALSAAKTILSANILGESCARACPVEVLCAGACVYNHSEESPIEIGRLQRFATSFALKESPIQLLGPKKMPSGKRVALIGAGPASLAAASMLALNGHETVIFEKRSFGGGLNAFGIAGYKFDHKASQREVNWLLGLGIKLNLNTEVVAGIPKKSQVSVASLLNDFDAIFLGLGLGSDKELLPRTIGMIGACELIEKIKTDTSFSLAGVKTAHIIGGGNTAIDAAHQLKLLGVENVTIVYRQSRAKMSAYAHELDAALASGVNLQVDAVLDLTVLDKNKLSGFFLKERAELIKTDLLVWAIGQEGQASDLARALDIELDERGRVVVDKNTYGTSNPRVFSAGDCVSGGQEVVNAVAEAKIAVNAMLKLLA